MPTEYDNGHDPEIVEVPVLARITVPILRLPDGTLLEGWINGDGCLGSVGAEFEAARGTFVYARERKRQAVLRDEEVDDPAAARAWRRFLTEALVAVVSGCDYETAERVDATRAVAVLRGLGWLEQPDAAGDDEGGEGQTGDAPPAAAAAPSASTGRRGSRRPSATASPSSGP